MSGSSTGRVLPDSSAWVEFLRGTGSDVHVRMRDALAGTAQVLVTEPVLMEVLAGARSDREARELRRLLGGFGFAPVVGPHDWIDAAVLYRRLRAAGRTLTSQVDCLIAVVALRVDAAVLHLDADFDAIAEHAPLEIA